MKFTVLGATGATGAQIVDQAVAAGHEVTVLVRDPARLSSGAGKVRVVTGDATSVDDLKNAIAGADAVLSALGSGNDRTSDIASRAATALIPAAEATAVSRVVVMSAFGVGASRQLAGGLQKLVISLMLKQVFADKDVADEAVRRSGLNWTLVYPVTLTNGPRTGAYTAIEPTSPIGVSRISRADVADFMIAQAGSDEWSHRTAVLKP